MIHYLLTQLAANQVTLLAYGGVICFALSIACLFRKAYARPVYDSQSVLNALREIITLHRIHDENGWHYASVWEVIELKEIQSARMPKLSGYDLVDYSSAKNFALNNMLPKLKTPKRKAKYARKRK